MSDLWTWSTQVPPPNAHQVRSDSQDWIHATSLFIDEMAIGNIDHGYDLAALKTGDFIRLQSTVNTADWALFGLTAPGVLSGTVYQFSCYYDAGQSVQPGNGVQIMVSWEPAGPLLTPGQKAYAGYVAAIHTTDPTGSVMEWDHIGAAEQANWEAAGRAAQH